jgi:hypothetical protein
MHHLVAWSKGGEASVILLEGDAITLRSSVPSPPGSRIQGTMPPAPAGGQGSGGEILRVKVHSSKRQEDGTFLIEGRVLDLTRALRERLLTPP